MSRSVRIKIVAKNRLEPAHFTDLPRRYPGHEFVLDPAARDYDWFVVYDDLPRRSGEKLSLNREVLACPPSNTILMTYEPSSIRYYGPDYLAQFAHVLTSHEPSALAHPGRRDMPPVGIWYYGGVADAVRHPVPPEKTIGLSTFMSPKQAKHTLNYRRYVFLEALSKALPEMEHYGRHFRPVEKKAEALDVSRYHVAVENHIGPHHWTEKLSDAFLGYCLPFYAGCPDAGDYFPPESFIPIDIDDPAGAAAVIREAMAAGEYERRLPAIVEARRRVMEEWTIPNFVGEVVERAADLPAGPGRAEILSRHMLFREQPAALFRYVLGKTRWRRANIRRWR
ncbi:hypothetical protein [Minwuia thermotolerans]|uniref:Glycosyltransferase n=1 Tax=Minwuia thermotolerans TaxID=2056226 RepID=A0A2M9FVY8_9PROT|nr:hypothetical protein [Minwuia thermotolerans]PJK27622.1 hypothetical protein CVT23_22190 [Minwuia thermotolerans]